jgi:hypothetical protein
MDVQEETTRTDPEPDAPLGAAPAETRMSASTARQLVPLVGVGLTLFIVAGAVQGLLRDGFDMVKHPLSLLSNGDLGWVNIANFVVSGLLVLVGAYALQQLLRGQPGGTWGPRLLGLAGIALVAGGVFVADPAFGFPDGAPALEPESTSWHGAAHTAAPLLAGCTLTAAMLVFARRWQQTGHKGLALFSLVTGVVYLALASAPQGLQDDEGYYNMVPLWLAGALSAAWAAVLCIQVRAETRP